MSEPALDAKPGERGERIAKWLARAGVASRRDAEKLIAEGRVRLGNRVVETPATFVKAGDLVGEVASKIDGKGGGRPDMAQGGGVDSPALPGILAAIPGWVQSRLG